MPVERSARKPSRADRGSPAPGAATHRGSQRNRDPSGTGEQRGSQELHSRARNRELVGCARASTRLQKSSGGIPGPEKRGLVGNEKRERGPGAIGRKTRATPTMSTTRRRGNAARRGKAGAGRSKGRCGAKAPDGWKASRIGILRRRSRAGDGPYLWLLSIVASPRERQRTQRESRQRCQRHGSQAPQRADKARGGQRHAARRSESPFVKKATSPMTQALTRLTHTGNHRGAGARTHT